MNEQLSAERDPSVSTSTVSAWQSKIWKNLLKIRKEKTLKHGKSSIHGHAIVAGERLQEKINESVTYLFCHGNVKIVENL